MVWETWADLIEAEFHVEEHSGGASGSVHDITLLKQDGTTGANLPNASFLLYGPVGAVTKPVPDGYDRDIQLSDGSWIHFIGYYTTGADGTIKISSQYLNYGGPFMLVEAVAPEDLKPRQDRPHVLKEWGLESGI